MPELPFSKAGLDISLNLAATWVMLEAFDFRPFAPRPPWRSAQSELIMWLLLSANVSMLAINTAQWIITK